MDRNFYSTSIFDLILKIKDNRHLIFQMIKREVLGRYKGSFLGLAWSFINPLLLLFVYTFVFSVIFKSQWDSVAENEKISFSVILFSGLIVYGLFSEVLNSAPCLISGNVSYVKKVVFPLQTLSIVNVGVALFHCVASYIVLFFFCLIFKITVFWTAIFIPIIMIPFLILILGLSWFFSSLGVYLRDINQIIIFFTSALLFLSPVFYPSSVAPKRVQLFLVLNPVTFVIEQTRGALLWGRYPDWGGLCLYTLISISVFLLGYIWFQKTSKGFADVL